MIVEVHSVARPGRPVLLLLALFVVLCGALGLAWVQSASKRSLAPPQNIRGTPLIVCPPRGWREAIDRPGHFFLADHSEPSDSEGTFERQITFRYRRLPQYVSPETYVATSDSQLRASSNRPEAKMIRGIRAIQVQRVHAANFRGHLYRKESVLRVACHPRGDVIVVEYAPMTELTRADFQLLDAICDALDFNDPQLKLHGPEAQKQVGLRLPTMKGWTVVGPQHPVSPTLFVLGGPAGADAGLTRVARSWRSETRTETDLLRDAILSARHSRSEKIRFLEWVRRDGMNVIGAQIWKASAAPAETFVAFALFSGPTDLALVVPDLVELSHDSLQIAQTISETLVFEHWPGRIDLAAARAAGIRLAAEVTERGPLPWWGRNPQASSFFMRTGSVEAGCSIFRRIGAGDRERGYAYSGGFAWANPSAKRYVRERWTLDSKALAFERSLEFGDCIDRLGLQFLKPDRVLWESRKIDTPTVWRRETRDGLETESEYPISPAFVAPPIEDLIAARVARGSDPAVLIETSNRDLPSSHTRLLFPQSSDDRGSTTVLFLEDYAPTGITIRFDSEDRPMQFVQIGLPLDRLQKGEQESLTARLQTKLDD